MRYPEQTAIYYWSLTVLYSLQLIGPSWTSFAVDKSLEPIGQRRCMKPVPIKIPECQNTFYNFTGMPNLVEQETQIDARHQLQTFKPLITYKCSSKLNFFLCSVYTPMCDVNTHHLIGPCRPLCEHVRARCAPVLRVFDFDWPANLNCSRFPLKNSVNGAMCMEGPEDSEESVMVPQTFENDVSGPVPQVVDADREIPFTTKLVRDNTNENKNQQDNSQLLNKWISKYTTFQIGQTQDASLPFPLSSEVDHPSSISLLAQSLRQCAHLKKSTFYVYVNRTGRCAPLCTADILFTPNAKSLSMVWTNILTGVCSLVTTFTLIGYALDSSLFLVCERPIIYIALCQLFYSLGYALSLGIGHETVTCGRDLDSGREIRLQEGLDNSVCALIFMIQYFFSIASAIWWMLTCVHWTLQISRCWFTMFSESLDDETHSSRHIDPYSSASCWTKLVSLCPCAVKAEAWDKQFIWSNGHVPAEREIHPNSCSQNQANSLGGHSVEAPGNLGSASVPVNSTQHTRFTETASYCLRNGKIVPSNSYAHWMNHRYDVAGTAHDRMSACLAREHVLVWLTAGLLTVGVLVSRQVDADELIPVCGVGRQHTQAMGAFVIGPHLTLLALGAVALLIGLIMLLRYKRKHSGLLGTFSSTRSGDLQTSDSSRLIGYGPNDQQTGSAKVINSQMRSWRGAAVNFSMEHSTYMPPDSYCFRKHDRQIYSPRSSMDIFGLRMSLFCLLYLLPAVCVASCDLYEFLYRDEWLRDPEYSTSRRTGESNPLTFPPKLWKPNEVVGPNPEIFMLRIFMSLVPGFTCSLWIFSVKGCEPWRRYLQKLWSYLSCCDWNQFSPKKQVSTLEANSVQNTIHSSSTKHAVTVFDMGGQSKYSGKQVPQIATIQSGHSTHPYAVYQYANGGLSKSSSKGRQSGDAPVNYMSSNCHMKEIDLWREKQLMLDPAVRISTEGPEMQHSNATTPGYYSHAKVGSGIEQNLSDTFSDESPIPPPLPATDRPHLPARGDPCIGASNSHVSAFGGRTHRAVCPLQLAGGFLDVMHPRT